MRCALFTSLAQKEVLYSTLFFARSSALATPGDEPAEEEGGEERGPAVGLLAVGLFAGPGRGGRPRRALQLRDLAARVAH